jgi:hypothetical protein
MKNPVAVIFAATVSACTLMYTLNSFFGDLLRATSPTSSFYTRVGFIQTVFNYDRPSTVGAEDDTPSSDESRDEGPLGEREGVSLVGMKHAIVPAAEDSQKQSINAEVGKDGEMYLSLPNGVMLLIRYFDFREPPKLPPLHEGEQLQTSPFEKLPQMTSEELAFRL